MEPFNSSSSKLGGWDTLHFFQESGDQSGELPNVEAGPVLLEEATI